MKPSEAIENIEYARRWMGCESDFSEEALDMAISALEKQVPMPVRITTSTKRCSNCGRQLSGIGNIHPDRRYCVKCGQAIDWEEEQ